MKAAIQKIDKKKWILGAVVVVCIFLLSLAIELVGFQWNLLFLKDGQKGTITYNLSELNKTGFREENGVWIAEQDNAQIHLRFDRMYVNKLEYGYNTSSDLETQITVDTYDVYGQSEIKSLEDNGAYQLDRSVQNIRMDTDSITLSVPEGTEITYIQIDNSIQWNPLRYLFICVVLFFITALIVFRKLWARKVEAGFLLVAVSIGILLLGLLPAKSVSWDEQIHFRSAYEYSFRSNVIWTDSAQQIRHTDEANSYSIEERNDAIQYMNEHADYNSPQSVETRGKIPNYKDYGYFAQAFMLLLGRKLGFTFSICYTLGRLGNFILYTFMMYMAIRNIKIGKRMRALIALMPTPMFLSCVYTYDAVITSFLMVAFSIIINELLEPEKRLSFGNAFLFIGLTIFACLPKAVYVFFILLGLLLPESKFQSKSAKWIFKIGLVSIFIILLSTYAFSAIIDPQGSSDSRGGDTDVARQLSLMLGHPLGFLEILFKNMQQSMGSYVIGSPSLLHYAYLGEYKTYNLQILMAALIIFTALTDTYGERDGEMLQLKSNQKIFLGLVVLGAAAMTWVALYVAFTPVGLTQINGVQGRYYIPLLVPFFLLFRSKKIKNLIRPETYHIILFGGTAFLSMFLIYHNILKLLCF